jgi:hypothetical protein
VILVNHIVKKVIAFLERQAQFHAGIRRESQFKSSIRFPPGNISTEKIAP